MDENSIETKIGFHASHEQWPPSALLRFLKQAEQAGFDAGMCSDHFHPWSRQQGQSGFTWSWLGAALQASKLSLGTVCAPGQRYHPTIIAQAAATLAEMFPGRFWLAVGSGEALNEVITADPWPDKNARNARLKECIDVMRALWAGETVDFQGHVRVKDAKLYTRAEQPPKIIGAALSTETAEWMGSWTDGLITVGSQAGELRKIIDAYRHGGGGGKPIFLQVALSFAATEEQAVQEAHQQWRQCALDPSQLADLPTPEAFDAATRSISPQEVKKLLRVSADVQYHLAWLRELTELRFNGIYLHQVARDMDRFIDTFGTKILPELRRK